MSKVNLHMNFGIKSQSFIAINIDNYTSDHHLPAKEHNNPFVKTTDFKQTLNERIIEG
jgi:hypothetical protein